MKIIDYDLCVPWDIMRERNRHWTPGTTEKVFDSKELTAESYARDGGSESWETSAIWEIGGEFYEGRMSETHLPDGTIEYFYSPWYQFDSEEEMKYYWQHWNHAALV